MKIAIPMAALSAVCIGLGMTDEYRINVAIYFGIAVFTALASIGNTIEHAARNIIKSLGGKP